jgi:hypothetical protein
MQEIKPSGTSVPTPTKTFESAARSTQQPQQNSITEKNKLSIERYVTARFAKYSVLRKARIIRNAKLLATLKGISMVMTFGLWTWYYLDYEVNLFDPKASNYLKNRLK